MSAFSKLPITMRGIYYTVSRLKLCTMCMHSHCHCHSCIVLHRYWPDRECKRAHSMDLHRNLSIECASKQFQVELFLVTNIGNIVSKHVAILPTHYSHNVDIFIRAPHPRFHSHRIVSKAKENVQYQTMSLENEHRTSAQILFVCYFCSFCVFCFCFCV